MLLANSKGRGFYSGPRYPRPPSPPGPTLHAS